MIIDASFKRRLREGQQIGCFLTFPSAVVTELVTDIPHPLQAIGRDANHVVTSVPPFIVQGANANLCAVRAT